MKKVVSLIAICGISLVLSGCAAPKTVPAPVPTTSSGTVLVHSIADTNYTGEDDTFLIPAQGFRVETSCAGDKGSRITLNISLDNTADKTDLSFTGACDGSHTIIPVKDIPTTRIGKSGSVSTTPLTGTVKRVDLLVTSGY